MDPNAISNMLRCTVEDNSTSDSLEDLQFRLNSAGLDVSLEGLPADKARQRFLDIASQEFKNFEGRDFWPDSDEVLDAFVLEVDHLRSNSTD